MADGDISISLTLDDKDFTVTVKNTGKILRELRQDLNTAATGVDGIQKHFGSFTTNLRHTVMSLAAVRFAMMDVYDVFLRLPKAILESSGEIERLTKLMGGLSKASTEAGRLKEATDNTKRILELAKNAPFEVNSLANAFVKLKSGGIDPTNGSLQALIDSVARFGGDSQSLHRASVAIQQMAGKGVISMEELRQQLGESIPDAMRMMAEGMGMTMGDLTKQVSLGAVESTDALRRMFTMMEFYNRGAAKDMMETWTGLNARLKTEWTILQTEIGNAGFADAVKDQLKDLISFMGSGQGIMMARQFGKDLGDLVRILREVTDSIRENWGWIKMLGEAILVYFAAGKIKGAFDGVKKSLGEMATLAQASAKKFRDDASMKAQEVARTTQLDAQAAATRAAQDASVLAKRKAYYTQLEIQHAQHIANLRRMEIARDIALARSQSSGLSGSAASAAALARAKNIELLRKESQALEKVMAREREAQRVISAGLLVSSQQSQALTGKATAAAAAAANLGVLSRAAIGLRVGLAALGGPLGLVTTALMIGIPAWLEWGNSGAKAIQKIRDALNSGTANEDTINLIGKQLTEKRKELDEFNNKSKGFSILPSTAADIQERSAEKKRLESEIAELERGLIDAQTQKVKNEGDVASRAQREAFQKDINETASHYKQKAGLILEAARTQLEGVKKGSLEEMNIEREKNAAIRKNVQDQADALHKIAEQQHKKASEVLANAKLGKNEGQIKGAQANYDELTEQLTEYARFRENAVHLMEDPNLRAQKEKKPDPLTQALEKAKGDLEAAKIRMDDLLDGAITFERIRDAALAELMGEREAGRFNVKDARGNSVKPNANDPKFKETATAKAQKEQIDRERQVQKSLISLTAQSAQERQNALERFGNGNYYEKETTGVRRLERQLAKLKETLVASDSVEAQEALKNFKTMSANIISDQAVADLLNFTAGFKRAMDEIDVGLQDTDIGRKQASFALEMNVLKSQLDARTKAITENAAFTSSEVIELTKKATEEANMYMQKLAEQQAKAMRTPLQQLSKDWDDVTARMRDASTRWSNQTMDAIVTLVKGGKVEWRDLVDTILTDIIRISAQKSIGGAINSVFDKGVNMLSGMMGGGTIMGGDQLPIDPTTGAVMTTVVDSRAAGIVKSAQENEFFKSTREGLSSVWEDMKLGMSNVWDGLTGMLGTLGDGLSDLVSGLGSALNSFLSSLSGGAGGGGGMGEILGTIFSVATTALGGLSGGMGGLGGMGGATASYTGYGGMGSPTMMRFANGGIMTEFGAVPLRKYLNGGIANSPQLALYGEGKKPEAYVPLPDGRSIPVTMSGGAGANVAINIIVNEDGSDKSSSSGSEAEVWSRMAQRVKSVIKEELVVQQRPGGSLYK